MPMLVENPETLGFHQEQTSRTNGNNERFNRNPRIGLYQTLYYLLGVFHSKFSKKISTTSFSYNTKIQNPSHCFNVSGNIIK